MVTGGFRSSPAMAQAVRDGATDICGMGRPLTAEPELSSLLLAGKTQKARANEVPEALQTGSSVLQLADIGLGKAIHDLREKAVADEVVATLMAGMKPAYPSHL